MKRRGQRWIGEAVIPEEDEGKKEEGEEEEAKGETLPEARACSFPLVIFPSDLLPWLS
jgi:hypothetical protein